MLELFFKRHFWVIHVAMIAVAAYLVATTIHIGTKQLLSSDAKVKKTKVAKRPSKNNNTRDFDEANDQNIFMGKRELLVPADAVASDVDAGPTVDEDYNYANAALSDLRARLVGVSVFFERTYSLASIVDEGKGKKAKGQLYSINVCDEAVEPLADGGTSQLADIGPPPRPCKELMEVAEVVHIALDRVYVKNTGTGRLEYIPLEPDPDAPKKPRGRAKKPRKSKGSDIKVTDLGGNRYEVAQSEVDKALGNLSSLATQARIVPAFEGGKAIGFKLFSIRPGSLYSKIGVQNGDVIQKVNGYEMNSPDQALEVYQKLKDSKSIAVDIKRRGKPVTLDYTIK